MRIGRDRLSLPDIDIGHKLLKRPISLINRKKTSAALDAFARTFSLGALGEKVRQPGIQVQTLRVNLATYDGVETLYREIQSNGQPVDAIAINAGVRAGGDFVREGELQDELNVNDLNVKSTVHLAKA